MAKTLCYDLSENLFLTVMPVGKKSGKKAAPQLLENVIVVDCSGSMSGDMAQIRQEVPSAFQAGQKTHVISFSGTQDVIVAETREGAASALYARGLTCFEDALKAALRIIEQAAGPVSFTFMSDGADNCSVRENVLALCELIGKRAVKTNVCSYGAYSDVRFLGQMAAALGGEFLATNLSEMMRNNLTRNIGQYVNEGTKFEQPLGAAEPLGGTVFSLLDDEETLPPQVYLAKDGIVTIDPSVESIAFLTSTPFGERKGPLGKACKAFDKAKSPSPGAYNIINAARAAAYVYITRMNHTIAIPVVRALGDVYLAREFFKAFGVSEVLSVADDILRYQPFCGGYDPNCVPKDDAITVLDVLNLMVEHDVEVDVESLIQSYNKIGRRTADANTRLNKTEQSEFLRLRDLMAQETNTKALAALSQRMLELTSKPAELKFTRKAGWSSVQKLVFNLNRPNVSGLFKIDGSVDLTARDDKPATLPDTIATHIWRNFSFVRDGVVNIPSVRIRMKNSGFHDQLMSWLSEGRVDAYVANFSYSSPGSEDTLDFTCLPVVSRALLKSTSAAAMAEECAFLLTWQAEVKALKYLLNQAEEEPGEKGSGFIFSEEDTKWLAEAGLTEKGFNPKKVVEPSTDAYMAKVLEVKIAGFSSLPSVKDVLKRREEGGSLTPAQALLGNSLDYFSDMSRDGLESALKGAKDAVRLTIARITSAKSSLLMANAWFTDLAPTENTTKVNIGGNETQVTFVLREVEEKILRP